MDFSLFKVCYYSGNALNYAFSAFQKCSNETDDKKFMSFSKKNKTEKGDNLSQYREIINATKTFYFTK